MFYADTALFGSSAGTRCGLEFFGIDKIVFASDCPFDPEGGYQFIRETMRVLGGMNLTKEQKDLVMGGNLRRMMRMA
jgi:aminocarboxymuconate-semialdehyde decarboxylase